MPDHADVTWGDKSNTTLMNKIQLLQNKAAKLILNMPKHSSATEVLDLLGWDTLEKRRRSHRLFLVFKSLNGLIDWNFNFIFVKDMHDHNTRFNNFSNSLIIHQVKTKKIISVKEVWIPGLN